MTPSGIRFKLPGEVGTVRVSGWISIQLNRRPLTVLPARHASVADFISRTAPGQ